jgi:hypothetical protein
MKLSKSELVLVGVVGDTGGLACILGCGVFSLPMKYLGLLLGLCIMLNRYGMILLRRWNVIWQVGKGFICLRVVG